MESGEGKEVHWGNIESAVSPQVGEASQVQETAGCSEGVGGPTLTADLLAGWRGEAAGGNYLGYTLGGWEA